MSSRAGIPTAPAAAASPARRAAGQARGRAQDPDYPRGHVAAGAASIAASAPEGTPPPAAPTRSSAVASSRAGRLPQRPVVGVHLDQQRDRALGLPGHRRPSGRPAAALRTAAARGHAARADAPARARARPPARGRPAAPASRADHDRRAQAGQAVGGRRRVINDQRAGHLRVAVRQQVQQDALPLPGPQCRRRRGQQDPAQHREQGEPGRQAEQLECREQAEAGCAGQRAAMAATRRNVAVATPVP